MQFLVAHVLLFAPVALAALGGNVRVEVSHRGDVSQADISDRGEVADHPPGLQTRQQVVGQHFQRHKAELRRKAIQEMLADDTDISSEPKECLGSGRLVPSEELAAKKCCGGRMVSMRPAGNRMPWAGYAAVCIGLTEKEDCMTRCMNPFGIGCSDEQRPKNLESMCDNNVHGKADVVLKCNGKAEGRREGKFFGKCEDSTKLTDGNPREGP